MALLDQQLFPAFAWNGPWLEDLSKAGEGVDPPSRLCWASEDAILLAPWRIDRDHWGGMLIAAAAANGKISKFYDEKGLSVIMQVPDDAVPKGAFSAGNENAVLIVKDREN